MNQRDHEVSSSHKTKPYIKYTKRRLELWIPKHGQIHRSLELTFDPGDLLGGPSEMITHIFDQGFCGSVEVRRAGEV